MDRGGTITWYLNANTADFTAGLVKARTEAKAFGADIDRSLNGGSAAARNSLKQLGSDSNTLGGNLRNVRKETVSLGNDSDRLKSALGNLALSNKGLNQSLGGNALRGFGVQLNDAERGARRANTGFKGLGLSLDDFHRSLGRSAATFRNMQIALRGFELTAMIVAATTAAGAILSLASAVAALSGLLFTIPSGIGVAAAAISTLKVATFGVGDAFKEVIKPIKGATAAQNLQRRQSDITASALKRDADLVRRLDDLTESYGDTLRELAEERMRKVNEVIEQGVEAWDSIAQAASNYLDISAGLADLQLGVAQATGELQAAVVNYGAASQQAVEAGRKLFAAQGRLAQSNADLDDNYQAIKDTVKDLATNLGSLQKANRNQITATSANLKALRLDKKARNESTTEIEQMIDVLDQLANIKDTNLSGTVNTAAAQAQLDDLKHAYPEIAVAAGEAATSTEKSLTKSLGNIAESMEDVRRERRELAAEMQQSLSDAAEQSAQGAQGKDPFAGLSANAASFVRALKEVYDAFQPIKNEIQDKFFAGLDDEIRHLADASFPTLRTGMGLVATSMNGLVKEASNVMQQPFFQGAIANSFKTTAQATDILKGAVEPLLRIFTDLMNIGNPYVLMLADWVKKQLELGAAFTSSADGQKRITHAIDLGLEALKQLFGLFKEVGGLLMDVFGIGAEEGLGMIDTLTEMVKSMREFIATEEGAAQIKALFEAADTILRAFGGNAGLLLQALLEVVEAFNNLDGPAKDFIANMIAWGVVLSPILTYLSSIWASGKLVFTVFREAFQIAGALGQMGAGIAGVMTEAEGMKGKVNDIGLAIHDAFGKGVDAVKSFGSKVAEVAKDVGTKGLQIAKDGAKAVGGWIVDSAKMVAGWATSFAQMIAKGAVWLATSLVQLATYLAAQLGAAIAVAAAWVVANAAMLGIFGLVVLAIIGAVALIIANWDTIKAFFIGVFEAIKNAVMGAINWVKENWPLLLAILTGPIGMAVYLITQNWETIKNAFAAAWEYIKGIWNQVGSFFNGIWNTITGIFNRVKDGIVSAFNTAVNWVRGIPGQILGALGNLGNMLVDSGWSLIMGLWHGISNALSNVKNWVSNGLRTIRNLFPFSPAKEGPFSGSGYTENSGYALMTDFGKGIVSAGGAVKTAATQIVEDVAGAFNGLATDVGAMQTNFGLSANSTMAAEMSGMAPPVMDARNGTAELSGGTPVVINQTNEVHTDVDMDQVNRNLAWEMNKL